MNAHARRLLALAASVLAVSLAPRAAPAADPIEIAAILSLTGQQGFIGSEQADALALIEKNLNAAGGISGRPIHFSVTDDQSSPQLGLQLATLAIDRKVPVVLGPSLTAVCQAVAPLFANGPVNYCYSPGIHPAAGSFVFGATPATTDAQVGAVRYFREKGWHHVAIIVATDASGQDAEKQLDAALALPENASMTVVDREHFTPTDLSVDAQMSRIKGAHPDVLVAWGTGTPEGTLLRGAADEGLDVPIYTSAANLTYRQMRAYAGYMPKVLLFPGYPFVAPDELPPGPTKTAVAAFIAAFKAVGVRPDTGQAIAWDPAQIVIEALKKIGPAATPAQIRDYIVGLHDYVGIYGPYDFRAIPQRGIGVSSIVVARWDVAKDTWVGVSKPGGMPL
jgi:branched-chain amino acid transport system substrate-binding protein